MEYVKTLSDPTSRLNDDFDHLKADKWRMAGLGESLPSRWGTFEGLVVPEASSRCVENFNIVGADHISISRPRSTNDRRFYALTELLTKIAYPEDAARCIHGLPTYATGLQSRSHEVQVKLVDTPVVGIIGMGGIGKTTIAKEVYNNVCRNFEYACFAENVKGIQKDELEDRLLKNCYRRGTRVDRNRIKWSDLEKTKTLFVVDDVDHEQIIWLRNLDFVGEGSRLIITSRDQSVLDVCVNSVIYEVDFLMDHKAKKLFCRHTFGEDGIPDHLLQENHDLKQNVEGVVRKCGGLPLTLEVMGCYLRRHKTNAKLWKETIENLGKAESGNRLVDHRVWSSLKVSYDGLYNDHLRGMFIEAGTYFFDQPLDEALAAWSTAYGNSQTAWANLLDSSMVKEIDDAAYFPKRKFIWVHEHLRDLANSLSKGATVSIYLEKDDPPVDLLNVVKSAKHLRIDTSYHHGAKRTFQLEILDKVEELKYLEVTDVVPEGSSRTFPKKLSLLIWRTFSGEYFLPISLQGMSNLAVLELSCTIPEESIGALGTLTKLRILWLADMKGIYRLPGNLNDLTKLHRLELEDLEDLKTLPLSIGHLPVLEELTLVRLPVRDLPESFWNLSSLATLEIHGCDQLRSLPECFGRLTALRSLGIFYCKRLQFLQLSESLDDNSRVGESADLFGSLSSLKHLRIENCPLESLPPSFGMLSSLEALRLQGLEQLDTLPENFGDLKALKRLKIHHAQCLKALPKSIGNLSSLEALGLARCDRLETLSDSIFSISSLRRVLLEKCALLKLLPDSWGEEFARHEDRSFQTRRTEPGQSSHKASAERIRLYVDGCPFLGSYELRRLGWIETDDQELSPEDKNIPYFWISVGKWYRRGSCELRRFGWIETDDQKLSPEDTDTIDYTSWFWC